MTRGITSNAAGFDYSRYPEETAHTLREMAATIRVLRGGSLLPAKRSTHDITAGNPLFANRTTAPLYTYVPVWCPRCGWFGERSLRTTWPACPKCLLKGSAIELVNGRKRSALVPQQRSLGRCAP